LATEWACPKCYGRVERRDSHCAGCGENLRKSRPVKCRPDGPPATPGVRFAGFARTPLGVGVLGACGFALLGCIASGNESLGRVYVWALVVWSVIGVATVAVIQMQDGWEDFGWLYRRPFSALLDNPSDSWFLAFVLSGLVAAAMLIFVVAPSMPAGATIWPELSNPRGRR
jgi:hypothetical protein